MRNILLILMVFSMVLLAACGQTVQEPTPVPEQSPAPKTVDTPNPAEPAETDTVTCVYPAEEAFCEHEGASMSLMIPAGWEYEINPYTEESQRFSIAFWPEDAPEGKVALYYYSYGFGVCGTGLTTRELTLAGGMTVSMGSYDDLESWSYIAFGDGFAAQNEGASVWWTERGDEALQILGSAALCKEVSACTSERPA